MNLSKVLSLFKEYWWVLAIVGTMAYSYFKINNMKEVLDAANKSYTEQISELKTLHKEELRRRDKIVKEYKEKIEQIEDQYKDRVKRAEKDREKRIKGMVDKFYNNPEGLKKEIMSRYGFKYVTPKSCN